MVLHGFAPRSPENKVLRPNKQNIIQVGIRPDRRARGMLDISAHMQRDRVPEVLKPLKKCN